MNKRILGELSWHKLTQRQTESMSENPFYRNFVEACIYKLPIGKGREKEEEILFLHFYSSEDNSGTAEFRVFFTKDDYITQSNNYEDGNKPKWRTASIQRILPYAWEVRTACINEESERDIRSFFNSDVENPLIAVERFQVRVLGERLRAKHEREEKAILKELEATPEVPDGFAEWIEKEAMTERRYIYYLYDAKKKLQTGLCTHCGETVEVKPKHCKKGICPSCGVEVTFKAEKKSACVSDDIRIALPQKMGDGFVVRYFWMSKLYHDYRKPKVTLMECYREVYSATAMKETYEYRRQASNGAKRWHRGGTKFYFPSPTVYTATLKEALDHTDYKYSAMQEYAELSEGTVNVYRYLYTYRMYPCIEYFVKLKLTALVRDLIQSPPYNGITNLTGKSLPEILGVNKKWVPFLVKVDACLSALEIVQKMDAENIKMTPEDFIEIAGILGKRYTKEVLGHSKLGTARKIARYVKGQPEDNRTAYILWNDYISMSRKLGYPLENDFSKFPRNLRREHDLVTARYEEEQRLLKREHRLALQEASKEILDNIRERYEFQDDEFFITAPEKLLDIVKEGKMLRHCVGSYVEDVAEEHTVILFLRKQGQPTKPFFTLEVDIKGSRIIQCYGFAHAVPKGKVKDFIEKFKRKKLKQKIEKQAV